MQSPLSTPLVLLMLLAAMAGLAQPASSQPSAAQLEQAIVTWKADTDVVSAFIQSAPYLSAADLVSQAAYALSSAVQEPVHKAVLDSAFLTGPAANSIIAVASDVLIQQGTFSVVLSLLSQLAANGTSLSPAQVQQLVQSFNANRCTFVLPAIDTYFQVTGAYLNDSVILTATRPSNCNASAAALQASILQTAIVTWQADTNVVSAFIQSAPYLSAADLVSQAQYALSTAVQEPVHKAVLDSVFLTGPAADARVAAASNVLIQQGTFPIVLSILANLAANGTNLTQTDVLQLVTTFNTNRCTFVLPAIDAYFLVTGTYLGNPTVLTATRPNNCFAPAAITAANLQAALVTWQADTNVVSAFIQSAPYLSPADLVSQAQYALSTAVQEPVHKGVMDATLSADPRIANASRVLIQQGTFSNVLSTLTTLATTGASLSQAAVLQLVQSFNANRCTFVLPAIDTYFQVTAAYLGSPTAPTATRPTNCNTTSISASSTGGHAASSSTGVNGGTSTSNKSGPLSSGAIAGLVVGISVGVALLSACLARQCCPIYAKGPDRTQDPDGKDSRPARGTLLKSRSGASSTSLSTASPAVTIATQPATPEPRPSSDVQLVQRFPTQPQPYMADVYSQPQYTPAPAQAADPYSASSRPVLPFIAGQNRTSDDPYADA